MYCSIGFSYAPVKQIYRKGFESNFLGGLGWGLVASISLISIPYLLLIACKLRHVYLEIQEICPDAFFSLYSLSVSAFHKQKLSPMHKSVAVYKGGSNQNKEENLNHCCIHVDTFFLYITIYFPDS